MTAPNLDYDTGGGYDDPLGAARGITFALLLAIPMWAVLFVTFVRFVR